MNIIYRIAWTIAQILRWAYRIEVSGQENVPEHGAILCPNHASDWDPILIAVCLPKRYPLRIMGKVELFQKNRLFAWFLRQVGAFPVDRSGTDIRAVKTAIKALRDGENLLMFPEGTTIHGGIGYHDGLPAHAHSGVAMIGVRTGAALVPVFCDGEKHLFHKTRIYFGTPCVPTVSGRRGTSEELQKIADDVLREAYALGGQSVGGGAL